MHRYKEDVFVKNSKGKKCIWARVDAFLILRNSVCKASYANGQLLLA
jgi:hypothetical protein